MTSKNVSTNLLKPEDNSLSSLSRRKLHIYHNIFAFPTV